MLIYRMIFTNWDPYKKLLARQNNCEHHFLLLYYVIFYLKPLDEISLICIYWQILVFSFLKSWITKSTNVDIFQWTAVLDTTEVDVLLRILTSISVPEIQVCRRTPLPGLSSRRFKMVFISREASRAKPVNNFNGYLAKN